MKKTDIHTTWSYHRHPPTGLLRYINQRNSNQTEERKNPNFSPKYPRKYVQIPKSMYSKMSISDNSGYRANSSILDSPSPKEMVPQSEAFNKKINEMEDEKTNEISDEKIDEIEDEKTNEIIDEKIDEITHEKIDEITHEEKNEITDEKANEIADEETNDIPDEKIDEIADEETNDIPDEKIDEIADKETNEIIDEKKDEIADEDSEKKTSNDKESVQSILKNTLHDISPHSLPFYELLKEIGKQINIFNNTVTNKFAQLHDSLAVLSNRVVKLQQS